MPSQALLSYLKYDDVLYSQGFIYFSTFLMLPIPENFAQKTFEMYGEKGLDWLASLPDLLQENEKNIVSIEYVGS